MLFIGNEILKVGIDSKGAELKSVYHQVHQLEYMWGADPEFWAKTSPVLFPIVGTLKDNTFQYKGRSYHLSRHGFARDKVFKITDQKDHSITFSLESDQETLAVFPFPFLFSIKYELNKDMLSVTYQVQNKGEEVMLFSIGGHPAFKVPLVKGTSYEDYQLRFEQAETAGRWLISKEGLIEKESQPLLNNTNILPLSKDLFKKDALVLKHLRSHWVELASDKTAHGLRFSIEGFPFLGLWAAPGADFVCIEPWCGIADSVDTDQQLQHKEGIIELKPEDQFSISWNVHFY
jgi:galactose mutarotase-like enzyme